MIGIYKITNPKGGIYIGKSKNIENRFKGYHKKGAPGQPKLHASLLLYGTINHKFEIVTECLECELNANEVFYITNYDSINGLNSKIEVIYNDTSIDPINEKRLKWEMYLKKQIALYKARDLDREKRLKELRIARYKNNFAKRAK